MNQQEVFNKIGGIINELNDHYKYLGAHPEKLNDLELEFFLANVQFLGHNTQMLIKLNAQNKSAEPAKPIAPLKFAEQKAGPKDEKYFEPVIQQPEPMLTKAGPPVNKTSNDPVQEMNTSLDEPNHDYAYTRHEPEIIRHELEIDESWADEDDDDEIAGPLKAETPVDRSASPIQPVAPDNPLAETEPAKHEAELRQQATHATEEVLTINQRMSAQLNSKPVAGASAPPVADLKSATSLNDKLLYIKDLFNNYSLAYSEAMEILNRFNSFEEADHFLKSNYSVKNNWADKPETTAKFYGLLKRRYA